MNKYEEAARLAIRDNRLNLNLTIEKLRKARISLENAKVILSEGMRPEQLVNEMGIN